MMARRLRFATQLCLVLALAIATVPSGLGDVGPSDLGDCAPGDAPPTFTTARPIVAAMTPCSGELSRFDNFDVYRFEAKYADPDWDPFFTDPTFDASSVRLSICYDNGAHESLEVSLWFRPDPDAGLIKHGNLTVPIATCFENGISAFTFIHGPATWYVMIAGNERLPIGQSSEYSDLRLDGDVV